MASKSLIPRQAHFSHFAGICVIALSVLAYQVLLTRIFSVMLYYHFAFVGISLAMLGLTIGAQKVFADKERFSPKRLETEWAKAALGFSVSIVVLTMIFLYIPPLLPFGGIISLLIGLFIIPFTYSGICVTLILTKSEASIGKLYAADLVGASLGCMGIVVLLFMLDPVTIIFGLAALAAFTAWFMAPRAPRVAAAAKGLVALWLILFALHGGLYLTHNPHFGVVWAKGHDLKSVLFERWNAFSLVRVSPISNVPFGWGFGRKPEGPGPDQLGLDIDAQAGTVITRFDGKNLQPFSYLADDVINAGYQIRPAGNVAVIGVGGGRDILSALYFGAGHITGIELNPSIFEALTRRFEDFSGHLDRQPKVSLVNAEARSWLNHSGGSYDLIQISLIDTWAATAAGGLSLSENRLYTVDAWKDFLNRLAPHGILTVSRWFDQEKHRGEFYRLLSLAAETLTQRGVAAADIKQHVLVVSNNSADSSSTFGAGIVTIAISPDTFSAQEIKNTRRMDEQYGFQLLMAPDTAWDDISRIIISGDAGKAFYAGLPFDVTPSTDDRPFFFHTVRLGDTLLNAGRPANDDSQIGENSLAIRVIFVLLLATFLCTAYFTVIPLMNRWAQIPDKNRLFLHLSYFGGIGLGFMLVEISQMQRLMIFLGHPVFGLTVVLFTLLLFGGIGSSTVGALTKKRRFSPLLAPVALCLVLCAVGIATPPVAEQLKIYGTAVRVVVSILLLAPAGFFMGMMFPLGMEATMRSRELQSWFWGINGATSVLGSVLGVVLSMESGISCAFWTGVAFYALCALLMAVLQKDVGRDKQPRRAKQS